MTNISKNYLEGLSSLNQLSLPGMLRDVVNYEWLNIEKLRSKFHLDNGQHVGKCLHY